MTASRTHSCMKKLAPLSDLVYKKTRLAFGSSFRRWVSVESGGREDFAEELSKGKRFAAVWGNGDFGRLGLGNLESQWRPKPILPTAFDDQGLKEIACGGAHTLFLTDNGDVYATGLNDFGQLGISNSQNYTTEPLRVSSIPKRIVKISAGYHHSSAITVDGELYIWGKNANGQLGLGKKAEKIISLPHKVECLDGVAIKTASLGFEHSIAITDKGEALSWGGGESGRLGHGHESSILGFQKSSRKMIRGRISGARVAATATNINMNRNNEANQGNVENEHVFNQAPALTQAQVVEQFRRFSPPIFNGQEGPAYVDEWFISMECTFDFRVDRVY